MVFGHGDLRFGMEWVRGGVVARIVNKFKFGERLSVESSAGRA